MSRVQAPNIFIATALPMTGETGVQSHFNYFREYLAETGTDSEVLTPYESPRVLRRALTVARKLAGHLNSELGAYLSRRIAYLLLEYRMRSRLPRREPWIMYAQCPGSALSALKFRRRPDQRVVLMVHFYISTADEAARSGRIRYKGPCYRNIRRQEEEAFEQVDAVVFCSQFMYRELLSRMPSLETKTKAVLPNFASVPERAFDGPSGDIISIGRLEPLKNQIFLLKVLAEANRVGRKYTLSIVGDGDDRLALQNMARNLGLASQVTFTGFVPHASRLLWRHRLYAHAATIENLPITIIEALAAGRPVLAPKVGGIPEMIQDSVEGYLWPLNDPAASAQRLVSILENREIYDRMQAAAHQRYYSQFAPQTVAPHLLSFLLAPSNPTDAIGNKETAFIPTAHFSRW